MDRFAIVSIHQPSVPVLLRGFAPTVLRTYPPGVVGAIYSGLRPTAAAQPTHWLCRGYFCRGKLAKNLAHRQADYMRHVLEMNPVGQLRALLYTVELRR